MNRPDISVIMPVYNAAPWMPQAVESVLWQEGPTWELLIVDDGSTDGTREIAESYAALDPRVRVLANAGRKGAAGARNTAMRAARGVFLFFLDGDDALFPGGLAALHGPLVQGTYPVVRGGGVLFCEQRWLAAYQAGPGTSGKTTVHEVMPDGGFSLHLYRADFLERNGIRFPEELLIAEDTDFLCRVYVRLQEIPVVERLVYCYRVNHKQAVPSVGKAASFARRAVSARVLFVRSGREDWIAPYLAKFFLPEWLEHLHAALETGGPDESYTGRENALAYLAECRKALAGLEEELAPALREQFGSLYEDVLAVWRTRDDAALLDFLSAWGLVRPASPYMGIDRLPEGLGRLWFRWSRRAAGLARGHAWGILRMLADLRLRALRRRFERPAPEETRP